MINTEFMRNRMLEVGIKQTELAKNVGVTRSMISYMLSGFKQPSLEVASRIAKELGCTIEDLLKD